MNYADNMFQGMMPSLNGLRVDLVTVCTVMISLTIVVICFYVLYEILWVPYKVQEAENSDRDIAMSAYETAHDRSMTCYDRDVAMAKYKSIVRKRSKL